MTLQVSEKSSQDRSRTRRKGERKSTESYPLARAHHAQAKLKWARAARDCRLSKMAAEEAELEELRQAIVAKSILIKIMKSDRDAAQKKVVAGRTALRESVVELDNEGDYIVQQTDSLFIDGLSSDFERLVSTSPSKSIRGSSRATEGSDARGGEYSFGGNNGKMDPFR